jgi:hypothetical protein
MTRWRWIVLIAMVTLLLNACAGTADPTATQRPSTDVPPEPTEAPTSTVAPAPTETAETDAETEPTATSGTESATATPADASGEEAEGPDLTFLDVRPDDWIKGAEDAEITIVEYADFQ